MAAILTVAKIRSQLKCLSVNEWTKQMWYVQKGTQFSFKKKEILPFVTAWVNLEDIKLSEMIQAQKDKHHVVSLICGI
jgi:hypothetical protein